MATLWVLTPEEGNVNVSSMYQRGPAMYVQATLHTYTPTKEFLNMSISKILVNVRPNVLPCVICKDNVDEAFTQRVGKSP